MNTICTCVWSHYFTSVTLSCRHGCLGYVNMVHELTLCGNRQFSHKLMTKQTEKLSWMIKVKTKWSA